MNRRMGLVWLAAMIGCNIVTAFASQAPTGTQPMKDACSITCYEKTPTCYVTQDKEGCLDISDKKPVCKDNKCVCELTGCEVKTVIKLKN